MHCLSTALERVDNILFVHLPQINSKAEWTEKLTKLFNKHVCKHENPSEDWIYLEVEGLTFSGLSTKTTLGNTLRTLLYIYHYIRAAGIDPEPWISKIIKFAASGDDGVTLCAAKIGDLIAEAIKSKTTRDTEP